jgi:hypothetical protein
MLDWPKGEENIEVYAYMDFEDQYLFKKDRRF